MTPREFQPVGASPRRRGHRSLAATICCAVAATSMFGVNPARADEDDADSRPDARLMGYTTNDKEPGVNLGSSTTAAYLATILLGTLAIAILFKGSGRTHLD